MEPLTALPLTVGHQARLSTREDVRDLWRQRGRRCQRLRGNSLSIGGGLYTVVSIADLAKDGPNLAYLVDVHQDQKS